jgi:hypothetical protein
LSEAYQDEWYVLIVALHMAHLQAQQMGVNEESTLYQLAESGEPIASAARFALTWLKVRGRSLEERVKHYQLLAHHYSNGSVWRAWTWAQIGKEHVLEGKAQEGKAWYRKAFWEAPPYTPPWAKAFIVLREEMELFVEPWPIFHNGLRFFDSL